MAFINNNIPNEDFSIVFLLIENKILHKEMNEYRDVFLNSFKREAVCAEILHRKDNNLEINKEIILNILKYYQNPNNL